MQTTSPVEYTGISPIISAEFLQVLRQHGVARGFLFGSVSRGEEGPDSDIDLLVNFAETTSLFDRIALADRLSALSGRRVDLMTAIAPAFAPYILPTLVPLPL